MAWPYYGVTRPLLGMWACRLGLACRCSIRPQRRLGPGPTRTADAPRPGPACERVGVRTRARFRACVLVRAYVHACVFARVCARGARVCACTARTPARRALPRAAAQTPRLSVGKSDGRPVVLWGAWYSSGAAFPSLLTALW